MTGPRTPPLALTAPSPPSPPSPPSLASAAGERAGGALLVAAHPDDETIGAGGLLAHLTVCAVVHLTDGAPRDPRRRADGFRGTRAVYARIRRAELLAALALAGVGPERVLALPGVDQEVALVMPPLARALEAVLRALRPSIVITHPYEGGHPDHDAAALIVRAAVARLRRRDAAAPMIVEMTSYHAGEGGLVTGAFLPPQAAADPPLAGAAGLHPGPPALDAVTIDLGGTDLARKRRMLACFATQRSTLAPFSHAVERFRPAPPCDFTRPPHDGPLHYERLGWILTGARFRELAAAALRELGLDTCALAEPRPPTGAPPPASAGDPEGPCR